MVKVGYSILLKIIKGNHYIYPIKLSLKKKINIFFLEPAWDDWSNNNNSTYASLHGLSLRPFQENVTGDISNASMLDEEFTNINMMIKYYKFGFGRATDIVNEAIRLGEISRQEEVLRLVEKYDGICDDEIIERYCKYISISVERENLESCLLIYTNKDLFDIDSKIVRPVKKFKVG